MVVKIKRVDENCFDFSCDEESFRLPHDRDLTIDGGKVIDPIKGIIFQRDLKEKDLALKIFAENKESLAAINDGGNTKKYYGIKWIFEDQSILPKADRIESSEEEGA